jgi:hypothetical protein
MIPMSSILHHSCRELPTPRDHREGSGPSGREEAGYPDQDLVLQITWANMGQRICIIHGVSRTSILAILFP